MKKGRFLWSAHRITERQKAGKARSIKGKQLKNSRNTVSKQLVEHLSSQRDNLSFNIVLFIPGAICFRDFSKINLISSDIQSIDSFIIQTIQIS